MQSEGEEEALSHGGDDVKLGQQMRIQGQLKQNEANHIMTADAAADTRSDLKPEADDN